MKRLSALPRARAGLMFGAALALLIGCGEALAADTLLWFESGRPSAQAMQAVEILNAAASHGLDPKDYDAGALGQAVARAEQGAGQEPQASERLDRALTAAVQRYLNDLHRGRVEPQRVQAHFKPPAPDDFDVATMLHAALAAHRLPEAAQEAAPRVPIYNQLREALAHYRELSRSTAWQQALAPLPGGAKAHVAKLEPGQAYAGVAHLAQRLKVLGDLPPQAAEPLRYEAPLVDAVRSFQARHGLRADGVIGKSTWDQLQVSPAQRVRQIELTLERLRWTPLMQGPRMVVVNVPEFVLRAYEVRDGEIEVQEEMKVIVGKAVKTRTPIFSEDMRFIEFSPYWNVPASISRAELVPKLRRDPGYWAREGFEFVGGNGRVSTTLSPDQLDAVLAGAARIRQRPGARNALGDIKFVFPNRDSIYLHHTPSVDLFERDRRDFSHGCIRVEQPLALAKFVLQGMPDWTEERIRGMMTKGQSNTLRLAEPVPVLIAYGTSLVKDDRIHFFPDIYGLDHLLDAALRQRVRNAPLSH